MVYSVIVIAPKLAEHQVQGVFSKDSNFHTKLPIFLPFDLPGLSFRSKLCKISTSYQYNCRDAVMVLLGGVHLFIYFTNH